MNNLPLLALVITLLDISIGFQSLFILISAYFVMIYIDVKEYK
jgi:hypothetical protein